MVINSRRLVFIDETWVKTNMTRLEGWCQLGQRLLGKVPHGRWKTLTLVAALRHDGVIAACAFDGPINGKSFLVREILIPVRGCQDCRAPRCRRAGALRLLRRARQG